MKLAKHNEKTGFSASSVFPIGELSDSHKLQIGVHAHEKKGKTTSRIAKDHSLRNSHKDAPINSSEKKGSAKTIKPAQYQPRSQQFPKENSPSSVRNSGSVSPRMQQKKLELEKRCCRLSTPPSDSNKPRRLSSKQTTTESGSPGRKLRPKVPNSQHNDDQLSEISTEFKRLSCQRDEIYLQSDCITVVDSETDTEVTSSLQSVEFIDNQSPSVKAIEHKKSVLRWDVDGSIAEIGTDTQDHPSPDSVLDVSLYKYDMPSPVKLMFNATEAGDALESKANESTDQWNPADDLLVNNTKYIEINRKRLQSIDNLVQKLRRLNSSHDETRIDYIASLCGTTNPDHRYISEILLASGLLLSSELLTFQYHSSGHPINPELFLVLELTKTSSLLSKEESSVEKVAYMKLNSKKFHRKLIFDAVNEILGAKLGYSHEPWLKKPNGLTKKIQGAHKLLKELCFEIDKLQSKEPECSLEEELVDGVKSMLWEDVIHDSESWTGFHDEIPWVVLDVERLIFKDLVDEVVISSEAAIVCQ